MFWKHICGTCASIQKSEEKEENMLDNTLHSLRTNITYKDTISFIPPIEGGTVVKVYDGDMIAVASVYPGGTESPLYRFFVRLQGIDCPKIKSNKEEERKVAQIAKKEMTNLLLHKIVTLKNQKAEKYGRILADVYLDNLHVNQYLLEKRLAVVYHGKGTPQCPESWYKYHVIGEGEL